MFSQIDARTRRLSRVLVRSAPRPTARVDRYTGRSRGAVGVAVVGFAGHCPRVFQLAAARAAGGGHFSCVDGSVVSRGIAEAVGLPSGIGTSPRTRPAPRWHFRDERPGRGDPDSRWRRRGTPGARSRAIGGRPILRAAPARHIPRGRDTILNSVRRLYSRHL